MKKTVEKEIADINERITLAHGRLWNSVHSNTDLIHTLAGEFERCSVKGNNTVQGINGTLEFLQTALQKICRHKYRILSGEKKDGRYGPFYRLHWGCSICGITRITKAGLIRRIILRLSGLKLWGENA
jgi:hypothetical protein